MASHFAWLQSLDIIRTECEDELLSLDIDLF